MDIKQAFGKALKRMRQRKKLTQEDFSDVSSRTYLSTLERGLKSPTLEKVEQLSQTIGIHLITLMLLTYENVEDKGDLMSLIDRVTTEALKYK